MVSVIVRLSDNMSAVFFRVDVVRTGQLLCQGLGDWAVILSAETDSILCGRYTKTESWRLRGWSVCVCVRVCRGISRPRNRAPDVLFSRPVFKKSVMF